MTEYQENAHWNTAEWHGKGAGRSRRREGARAPPGASRDSGTEIYDHVRSRPFLGLIGALVQRLLVRGWVEGIFDYRAGEVPALLTRAPAAPHRRTA